LEVSLHLGSQLVAIDQLVKLFHDAGRAQATQLREERGTSSNSELNLPNLYRLLHIPGSHVPQQRQSLLAVIIWEVGHCQRSANILHEHHVGVRTVENRDRQTDRQTEKRGP